jgi:branched-chain amino acid transport system permease protein
MAVVGPPIERILRTVYDRDESFQLLLTFAMVLMFQDIIRFLWGANPTSLDNVQLVYGKIIAGDFIVPVYNLLVIAAAIGAAALIGLFLQRTNYGRLLRDGREPHHGRSTGRERARHLRRGVHARHAARHGRRRAGRADGGSLLDMAVDVVIEAFAVVVIGG